MRNFRMIPNRLAISLSPRMEAGVATLLLAVYFLTMSAIMPARAAVEIQEVTSPGGVTAWLVEDYSVPMISVRFAFRGGSAQDPEGQEGIANLMTGLFDEGAGDLDSDAFQELQDELGADMSFEAGQDAIYGQMRMLADDRTEALDLLRLAVNEPRFDQEPLDRIRSQIVTSILADERNPQSQGREAFAAALYGDHPYGRRADGTVETLSAITADDLRAFHGRIFARSDLYVAVVGAIDADTLSAELDRVFGALPQQAELTSIDHVEPELDQTVRIEFPLPQTTLQFVYPGIKREDPEFFAAFLMNHILGGGTFSSRLFEEVRERRGLAYGIGSYLQTSDYAESMGIGTSTRSDRVGETRSVIEAEIGRMVEEGPSQQELDLAKTYVIGAYAINNLDSSASVARTLVELQKDDMGIDYIERRTDYINAVTLDEVKAAAQRLLTAEPAVLIVGPGESAGGEAPAAVPAPADPAAVPEDAMPQTEPEGAAQ